MEGGDGDLANAEDDAVDNSGGAEEGVRLLVIVVEASSLPW